MATGYKRKRVMYMNKIQETNTRLQAEINVMDEEIKLLSETEPFKSLCGDDRWRSYILIQIALLRLNKMDR